MNLKILINFMITGWNKNVNVMTLSTRVLVIEQGQSVYVNI